MAVPTLNLTVLLLLSSLVMSVLASYVGAQAQQSSFQVCDCNPYYSLGCLCVSQSSCDSNNYIVGQIPDLDFDYMEVLSLCRGIEFCCRIPRPQTSSTSNGQDLSKNANPDETPATTTNTNTNNGQDSSFSYTDCGLLRITATSRRAPWVAALFKTSEDGRRSFLCAGSIVHPSVVMTAGGCLASVSQNDSLSVVASLTLTDGGDASTQQQQQQELRVESVFRSEYYDPSKSEFDFMLMRLVAPFTRDPSVNVVCLPQPDSRLDLDSCLSAGFTSAADGSLRQRQTDVAVRSNSVCESKLWDIMGEDFVLPIGMTCAEGPSLCQSTPLTFQEDYGGPVTCPLVPDPTRYVQVGILSKPLSRCGGAGGDPDDVPALVTSTTFFGPTIQWMLADIVSDNYAVHPTYNNTNQ